VLRFHKYHAAQNDFVVVTSAQLDGQDVPSLARALCHRRTGAGADGLLVVSPEDDGWRVAVINADGSAAETSGNGLRCAAQFLLDGGEDPQRLGLVTEAGPSGVRVSDGKISVDMGPPRFSDPTLPASHDTPIRISMQVGERDLQGTAVSMGNPHLVLMLEEGDDLVSFPLRAAATSGGTAFPGGVNVEVCRRTGDGVFDARVWERGVGETRSCGSGACAIAAVLATEGEASPLEIRMPGGVLQVDWRGEPQGHLWLTGPVVQVFEGRTSLLRRCTP